MIVARVLVGVPGKSNSSLLAPPMKRQSTQPPFEFFDSAADNPDAARPDVVVVFNDAQAYPAYCIEFM